MNTDQYMHDVDLGLPLDVTAALKDQRDSEPVRALLQYVRDKAAGLNRLAQVTPETSAQVNPQNPLEHRAFYSGGAHALEALFFELLEPPARQEA